MSISRSVALFAGFAGVVAAAPIEGHPRDVRQRLAALN